MQMQRKQEVFGSINSSILGESSASKRTAQSAAGNDNPEQVKLEIMDAVQYCFHLLRKCLGGRGSGSCETKEQSST
jgi:hypothetical protein